jgi:hypothetical protein
MSEEPGKSNGSSQPSQVERSGTASIKDLLLSRVDPTLQKINWLAHGLGISSGILNWGDKASLAWLKNSTAAYRERGELPQENKLINEWVQGNGSLLDKLTPVWLEDFGCGNGIKTGLVISSLVQNGFNVGTCLLMDATLVSTEYAESQIKEIVTKTVVPNEARKKQEVDIYQYPGDFTKSLHSMPQPASGEQRIRLCLGNTVSNLEEADIYSVLARGMRPEDLLLIGLDRRLADLPPYLANKPVRDDSPDLDTYPDHLKKRLKNRAEFGRGLKPWQAEACGLSNGFYESHTTYDPSKRMFIDSIVLIGINEQDTPELWELGFRSGQEIQVFTSRFYTIEEHKEGLSRYFKIIDIKENPQSKDTLFVLRT